MSCAVPPPCLIEAKAYSANKYNQMKHGYLKLNGTAVWQSSWHGGHTNDRGVNMIEVDTCNCTLSKWQNFDTSSDSSAGDQLREYLQRLDESTVLVGVTAYEASRYLDPAEAALAELGANVSDVGYRGAWVFVTEKGDKSKTVFDKESTEQGAFARQPKINTYFSGA